MCYLWDLRIFDKRPTEPSPRLAQSAVTVTSSPPIIDNFTAIITTSTGAIQCWREQDQLWSRDEALADIKAVKMVELPERKSEEVKVLLEDEGVFGRAMRHVKELKVGGRCARWND
jgi:hypothetical protein